MPDTVSGSDAPPLESRVGDDATCLRCDWIGATGSDACPRCEAPLYRLRASTERREVASSSRALPSAGDPASDAAVEVPEEGDNATPAVFGAVSRRTWVIVGALTVAALWIATTGGPFGRLWAHDVPPTASPQGGAQTASPQDRADTSPGGRSALGGPALSRPAVSGLNLNGVNGDVTSAPARSPNGSRLVFGARGGTIYSEIVQS